TRAPVALVRSGEKLRAPLHRPEIPHIAIMQDVAGVTDVAAALEREAPSQRLGEPARDMAGNQPRVVVAEGNQQLARRLELGLRGDDAERAADHILAVQHALWSADHLHSLE